MATTYRTLIRIEAEQAGWFRRHHGRSFPVGTWVAVEGCARGKTFSKLLHATVVELSLQSSVDQIWIHGFVDGVQARELLFDEGAWQLVSGEPFAFEDTKTLKRWLARKRLLSSDGHEVLDALLGRDFVLAGAVAEAHVRADATPAQLKREAARLRMEEKAAARAERRAREDDFDSVFLLAEARHEWARRLNPTGVELPAWVVCETTDGVGRLLEVLDCTVLVAHSRRGREFLVSVFEGAAEIRVLGWHAQMTGEKWWTEGEALGFEDHRRVARLMAGLKAPDGRKALSAFIGHSARITALPLTQAALEKLRPSRRR